MGDPSRRITASTRVVGVIGHPVRHSLSPVIHNVGFRSTGADFAYVAFDVPAGRADSALEAVRVLDLAGLSVTMPHKAQVARSVDDIVDSARRLDSVNTVEVAGTGRLIGHSTDGDGLVQSLRSEGVSVDGCTAVVFGAGGAGRSVIDALARHGAARIHVVNRSAQAAEKAAQLAPDVAETLAFGDEAQVRASIASSTIVINATSIGMRGSAGPEMPFDPTYLEPDTVVVDLVYHPVDTALLSAAVRAGCQVVNGLGMLVHQAALQQVIWTGSAPDIEEMTRAARQALL